jgi:hypothetical protein
MLLLVIRGCGKDSHIYRHLQAYHHRLSKLIATGLVSLLH